jgi:hypothetical protein
MGVLCVFYRLLLKEGKESDYWGELKEVKDC